jgi:threonine dehydrogenase-like Zn-dependent dehydrogenase
MGKKKTLIYMDPGNPVFIEEDIKEPGPGCVGIDILASSLCNTSELRSFKGGYETGYGVRYPMVPGEPGHEAVGVIVEIGAGVAGFKKGDYVVMTGHGGEPCHKSHVTRNVNDIAIIYPDDRDPEQAAVLEMYGCAWHCAVTPLGEDYYRDRNVLVQGMGAMGLCTVQILSSYKTGKMTAVDLSDARLDTAKKCGADIAVKPDEIDKKEKYDVIIECSGSVKGQETACEMAPSYLIFSSYNTKYIAIRQDRWFDARTAVFNPGIVTSESFKQVTGMYNEKLIDPFLLINRKIKPRRDEYLDAIQDIEDGKVVKVLLGWR